MAIAATSGVTLPAKASGTAQTLYAIAIVKFCRTILIVRRAALTAFATGSKLSPRKTASDALCPTSLAEPGAIET